MPVRKCQLDLMQIKVMRFIMFWNDEDVKEFLTNVSVQERLETLKSRNQPMETTKCLGLRNW